jgi:hypothetical protein
MGKFLDSIRKKLGLGPERTVTITGKIPSKVIVNRSVSEQTQTGGTGGAGGYPFYAIPTPSYRPQLGSPYVDIGQDTNLTKYDKDGYNSKRRKSKKLQKIYKEDMFPSNAIDSTVPTAYANPSTPVPTVTLNKKKALRSLKQKMQEDRADCYDDKNIDTETPTYNRGTRVKIKKDGYYGRGNVDYYDNNNKTYVISVDGGHNGYFTHDDIEPIKEEFSGLKSHHSPTAIATKFGTSVAHIMNQLELGTKIELEHTTNHEMARDIALQHLDEDPKYYTKLRKAKL